MKKTDDSSDFMKGSRHFLLFLFLMALFADLIAQRKNEKQINTDTLPGNITFSIYEFKNINKKAEYFNKSKYKKILELEEEQDYVKLYPLLKEYVSNFGIQNFYKDTKLIWRLAKLTELYGEQEDAIALYRMVLRHHHQGINIREIEVYYDTLNNQAAEQFVPIEYYYELVEHRKMIDTLRPPRGVMLNMGSNINSRKADYAPTITTQNNSLIFTSKRNSTDIGIEKRENEDLFISTKDAYDNWSVAEPMSINSRYNEGSACLSKDGKTLYFSRCECMDCYGDCDIFSAQLQSDSTWGQIKNLGVNVNSVSWDSHPSLSHSGDTLYFASDRLGGFGLSDIYYTTKTVDGNWTKARNLGPIINTRNNDVSPFYHPVFDVLYFASNGQLYNFGEFDIFRAHLTEKGWSEPHNIGPLVNGRGSEFYFTIDANSEYLYYARSVSRDLNKQDLYSFPLPMEAQPNATTQLSGSLTDSLTGQPFSGIVSIIDLDEGVEIAPKFLRPDGTFEFDLIDQRNYLLVIQGDDFFRIEEAFFLDGPLDLSKVTEPIAARVKFSSIEFENGKAGLKSSMYADLNKIVNFMYDNPEFRLRISGHTDDSGSEEFNLELSKERAKNIRDYIVIFAGVYPDRVEYEGYGSSRPIVEPGQGDESLNRRVEFEIYRPGREAIESAPSQN